MKDNKNIRLQALVVPVLASALTSITLIGAYVLFSGEKKEGADKSQLFSSSSAISVSTAKVSSADVPIYISALGRVSSTASVTVRSQVNGRLMSLAFEEGQLLKKDSLIAEIDSRLFEAQLLQVKGQLERNKALLLNAKLDLERYKKLIKSDAISQQTLDTQKALVRQYEGNVETDLGQMKAAELNLEHCKIRTPISGRAGLREVDVGNLVYASDAKGIVIINTVQPINVIFSIPEDQVNVIAQKILSKEKLLVEVYDRMQDKLLATGTLMTMDNHIDPNTGTIKLKAQMANDDGVLFPNQFVNIKLLVETMKQSTVIPAHAVQYGSNGSYVYAVNNDNTVKVEAVTVLNTYNDLAVIQSDQLPLDSKVVTSGVDNLKEGSLIMAINDSEIN